jgi:RNA-splicing ligase RtcB
LAVGILVGVGHDLRTRHLAAMEKLMRNPKRNLREEFAKEKKESSRKADDTVL